jgi:hypothetical protein
VVSLLKCPKLLDHYRYGTAGVGEGAPIIDRQINTARICKRNSFSYAGYRW